MPHTIVLPLGVALVCASTYAFGLFLGALLIRAPRWRNIVHNVAMPFLMALCGVVVPVAFWPAWAGIVASLLPITHGLGSVRLLLAGGGPTPIAAGLALEVVIGLAWLGLAAITMDWLANRGRADGSIEFV
jgi:ABC-2 type transport system permease protein